MLLLGVMALVALWLLRLHPGLLRTFAVGAGLNAALNHLLKYWIHAPRPSDAPKEDYWGAQRSGMPSGHAQMAAYVAAFVAQSLHDPATTALFACLAIAVSGLRYVQQYHTVAQLGVGLAVGSLVGICTYKAIPTKRRDNHVGN
jgi:membrane-associated phospholipid phosphatase